MLAAWAAVEHNALLIRECEMRSSVRYVLAVLFLGGLAFQTGCQSGGHGAGFLSLIGLSKKPVVISLGVEPGVLNPFANHEKLRKALEDSIGRPVQLRLSFPIQLEPNLELGFYHFAAVTPGDYLAMPKREKFEPIVVSVDESGREARLAVLVVRADSTIQSIEELRGKTLGFGPAEDARTHQAGLALLREHGIEKADLSLGIVPLPGSLKHFPKMRDIAQSVINQSSDAGFIDEAAFEALPETADVEGEPSRDKLRVIGRTVALPGKILIRSPKAEQAIVDQVAQFLLTADQNCPDALKPLFISAFHAPSEEVMAACNGLAGQ